MKSFRFGLTVTAICFLILAAVSCSGLSEKPGTAFIADYSVAKESTLRNIPRSYIDFVREHYHIAYQHTSHGTHITYGLNGLQRYKDGDEALFGVTFNGVPVSGKLDFEDYALGSYHADGVDASDLSRNETAFIQATRNFLDAPENSDINVVMWSWCSIFEHNVRGNYLPGMQALINEYGAGGSKPRASITPVTFIFMTGHAQEGNNIGEGRPKNQADIIRDFCEDNNYYCLDYFSIESHDYADDTYYSDCSDDSNSSLYGGNYNSGFQSAHAEGEDWFINYNPVNDESGYGAHLTQHITANRKAYAFWWILARNAGWNGL